MGLFTTNDKTSQKKVANRYRDLIRQEAIIGGKIFGPIQAHGRREFFCLDERTWVWHEEWIDKAGTRHVQTTRYDIRPDGVVKSQNNSHYTKVSLNEAQNLLAAARVYKERVKLTLYANV